MGKDVRLLRQDVAMPTHVLSLLKNKKHKNEMVIAYESYMPLVLAIDKTMYKKQF